MPIRGPHHGVGRGVHHGVTRSDEAAPPPSAPTFIAAGSPQAATDVGLITVPWPAGHQVGDVGILLIETTTGASTVVSAAGFTALTNSPQSSSASGTATKLWAFWCRADSTSMASPTAGVSGNNHMLGVILTFRGCVASGDPVNISAGGSSGGSATTSTV